VPAANRDPSATERPDEFIIDRAPARHFAFGAGMHSCLGEHLARWKYRWRFSGCWRHTRTFSGPRRRNGSLVRKAARSAGWTSRSGK